MIFSNSSYKGYSRPGDSHIINLTNNQVSPGVYDPNGQKINLHVDENNRLYYQVVQDGLIKKIYIQSSNEEFPPCLQEEHVSQIDLGCVKKGQIFPEGYTLENLIVDLFERNDFTPIQASGNVIFSTESNIPIESNTLEVTFDNTVATVTHECKVIPPGFQDVNKVITRVPNYQYDMRTETNTIEAKLKEEHSYPVIYNLKADKEYTASEQGLKINLGNGNTLPSTAVIPVEEITIASQLLVSYKWILSILDYQKNISNLTYNQIKNSQSESGWIEYNGDTLVKNTITVPPGKCVVLMIPNKPDIRMSAKKLGTTSEWNSITPLTGNQNMKIYYINIPPSGVDSEYTQLKIIRT